jgi:hypothetical protein
VVPPQAERKGATRPNKAPAWRRGVDFEGRPSKGETNSQRRKGGKADQPEPGERLNITTVVGALHKTDEGGEFTLEDPPEERECRVMELVEGNTS